VPIEIAGISLPRVHRVVTRERADFVSHRIPGLDGDVVQDMGRHSVRLEIEGIFYGEAASDDLEALRDVYKNREPVDFLAEIVGQAYFSQVILEELAVQQAALEPEQFSYRLTVSEYVPPPQPAAGFEGPDIDGLLELEALDFMDLIQLPDLLSAPDFGDPTPPLQSVLDSVGNSLGALDAPAAELTDLFGSGPGDTGALGEQLGTQADDSTVTGLIDGQVEHLSSAGQTAGDVRAQSAGGIEALQSRASGFVPPDINRTDALEQGFRGIQDLLPTEASDLLGGLPDQMDDFFGGLQDNLVGSLGGILDKFSVLNGLGIGTNAALTPPEGNQNSIPFETGPGARRGRDLGEINAEIQRLLDLAPDPLNARSLLELLSEQLRQLPRERIPLQNLPVYDELNEKLETVLHWLASDGAGVAAHLAQTSNRLSDYIRAAFYEHGVTPVKSKLENLGTAVDLPALQTRLVAAVAGLNVLADRVRNNTLGGSTVDISALAAHIAAIREAGIHIGTHWVAGDGRALAAELPVLGEKLEERMADLLLLSAPGSELAILSLALAPLNDLLDATGINNFIGGIRALFDSVTNLIEQINIAEISDDIQDVIDTGSQAIQDFRNLLVNVTIEISMLMNRVEQAIDDIGLDDLVASLRAVLQEFEQLVVNGLEDLFHPIRDFLQTAFDQINNIVAAFDPRIILQAIADLIAVLTDILKNPVLLDTVGRIKSALENVNTELGNFSFRTVTDVVVDGIGVVKGVLEIGLRIPMPDSVATEVRKALNALPDGDDLRGITGALEDGLETIIEEGAKPVLLAVKDKPAEFVAEVEKYSPDRYLGDRLSAPYQAFVGELENLKPTTLMEPVSAELNRVLDEVREAADPTQVFSVLQGPFDTLYNALDGIDPQALIQPVQAQLTAGIQAVTDNLPLDAADAVFGQVDSIAKEIGKAVDAAGDIRDILAMIDARLAGLGTAETQIAQMGDDIVAKLNAVGDMSAVTAALTAVETALDDAQSAPLQAQVFPLLDALIAQLENLDAQNRLVALVQAQRGFPLAQLQALNNSDEKTALLDLLADFDPLDDAFTEPLGTLQDRKETFKNARTALTAFFPQWQTRYFTANGPLGRYRQKNLTLPQLKSLLETTVREQVATTLSPVFKVVQQFQSILNALLDELIELITALETQVNGLLEITDALERLRQAIRGLVDDLESLDITFIATEMQDIFDAVKAQLQAINPQNIANLLKTTFDHLLDAINPNNLLGLPALDGKHQELIDLLRSRDPKVLLTDTIQPEFDKIITFLKLFDLSEIIATFLQRIEDLQSELSTELDRTVDAYEEMIDVIPTDMQAELSVSFSS
jgi:archaellum component FlaC